jgi:hypothetical protein
MTIVFYVIGIWSMGRLTPSFDFKKSAEAACLDVFSNRASYESATWTAYKAGMDKHGRILWSKPLACELKP